MNLSNRSYNRSKTTSRFCLKCRENGQTTLSHKDRRMESSFCLFLFSGPSGNFRDDYGRQCDADIKSVTRQPMREIYNYIYV